MSQYTEAVTPGDVTAAVIHILRNDTNLKQAFPSVVVSDTRVGFSRNQPWIQVTRRGGVPPKGSDRFLDYARIDIDAYGPTRTAIIDLTRLARDAVANAISPEDGWTGFGVCITDVDNEQGANEMPDPKTQDPRGFQVLGLTVANRPDHMGPPDVGGEDQETLSFVETESVEVLPFLHDTFTRTVSNGWGNNWVASSGASLQGVNGAQATASGNTESSYPDVPADFELSCVVRPMSLPSSGNAVLVINTRIQTSEVLVSSGYRYWMNITSTGAVNAFIFRGGSGTALATGNGLVTGLDGSNQFRVRVRSVGSLHLFKAWLDGTQEPDWQLGAADSTFLTGGLAGVENGWTNFRYTFGGTGIPWRIDDVEINRVDS